MWSHRIQGKDQSNLAKTQKPEKPAAESEREKQLQQWEMRIQEKPLEAERLRKLVFLSNGFGAIGFTSISYL